MQKKRALLTFLCALALTAPTVAFAACGDSKDDEAVVPDAPIDGGVSEENGGTDKEEPDVPVVTPTVEQSKYIRCTGDSVYFRTGAGTSYSTLGSAKKGEIYAVVDKTGGWYKTYYRGKTAYLSASYATLLTLDPHEDKQVENVLHEGYKLLGVYQPRNLQAAALLPHLPRSPQQKLLQIPQQLIP